MTQYLLREVDYLLTLVSSETHDFPCHLEYVAAMLENETDKYLTNPALREETKVALHNAIQRMAFEKDADDDSKIKVREEEYLLCAVSMMHAFIDIPYAPMDTKVVPFSNWMEKIIVGGTEAVVARAVVVWLHIIPRTSEWLVSIAHRAREWVATDQKPHLVYAGLLLLSDDDVLSAVDEIDAVLGSVLHHCSGPDGRLHHAAVAALQLMCTSKHEDVVAEVLSGLGTMHELLTTVSSSSAKVPEDELRLTLVLLQQLCHDVLAQKQFRASHALLRIHQVLTTRLCTKSLDRTAFTMFERFAPFTPPKDLLQVIHWCAQNEHRVTTEHLRFVVAAIKHVRSVVADEAALESFIVDTIEPLLSIALAHTQQEYVMLGIDIMLAMSAKQWASACDFSTFALIYIDRIIEAPTQCAKLLETMPWIGEALSAHALHMLQVCENSIACVDKVRVIRQILPLGPQECFKATDRLLSMLKHRTTAGSCLSGARCLILQECILLLERTIAEGSSKASISRRLINVVQFVVSDTCPALRFKSLKLLSEREALFPYCGPSKVVRMFVVAMRDPLWLTRKAALVLLCNVHAYNPGLVSVELQEMVTRCLRLLLLGSVSVTTCKEWVFSSLALAAPVVHSEGSSVCEAVVNHCLGLLSDKEQKAECGVELMHCISAVAPNTKPETQIKTIETLWQALSTDALTTGNAIVRAICTMLTHCTSISVTLCYPHIPLLCHLLSDGQVDTSVGMRLLGLVGAMNYHRLFGDFSGPSKSDMLLLTDQRDREQQKGKNRVSKFSDDAAVEDPFASFVIHYLSRMLHEPRLPAPVRAEIIVALSNCVKHSQRLCTPALIRSVVDVTLAGLLGDRNETTQLYRALGIFISAAGKLILPVVPQLVPQLLNGLSRPTAPQVMLVLQQLAQAAVPFMMQSEVTLILNHMTEIVSKNLSSNPELCSRALRVLFWLCPIVYDKRVVSSVLCEILDDSTAQASILQIVLRLIQKNCQHHNLQNYAAQYFVALRSLEIRLRPEHSLHQDIKLAKKALSEHVGKDVDAYAHLTGTPMCDALGTSTGSITLSNNDSHPNSPHRDDEQREWPTTSKQCAAFDMQTLKIPFDMKALCIRLLLATPSKCLQGCVSLSHASPSVAQDILPAAFLALSGNPRQCVPLMNQMEDLLRIYVKGHRVVQRDDVTTVLRMFEAYSRLGHNEAQDSSHKLDTQLVAQAAEFGHHATVAASFWERSFVNATTNEDRKLCGEGLLRAHRQLMHRMSIRGIRIVLDEVNSHRDTVSLGLDDALQCQWWGSRNQWTEILTHYREQFDDDRCRHDIMSLGIDAALTLGEWGELTDDILLKKPRFNWVPDNVIRVLHSVMANNLSDAKQHLEQCWNRMTEVAGEALSDSYGLAVKHFVNAQYLTELHEIIEFKASSTNGKGEQPFPQHVRRRFDDRFESLPSDLSTRMRFLSLHSLVVPPREDSSVWLEHIHFCLQEGCVSMAKHCVSRLLGMKNVENHTEVMARLAEPELIGFGTAYCDVLKHCGDRRSKSTLTTLLDRCTEPQHRAEYLWRLGKWESARGSALQHVWKNLKGAAECRSMTNHTIWYDWALMCLDLAREMEHYFDEDIPTQEQFLEHALFGLKNSLMYLPASYPNVQHLLKLLTVLFDFSTSSSVNEFFKTLISWQPKMWFPVLPQIVARLEHPEPKVREVLAMLLRAVAGEYTQEVVFALIVFAGRQGAPQQQSDAHKIIDLLRHDHAEVVKQAQTMSSELTNASSLWMERWAKAAQKVWEKFEARKYDAVCDDINTLIEELKAAPTPLEKEYYDRSSSLLTGLQFAVTHYHVTRRENDIIRVWNHLDHVNTDLTQRKQYLRTLSMRQLTRWLSSLKGNTKLRVPGTRVRLHSVKDEVEVIQSKQRPRKVCFVGEDGVMYNFLLKGNEDLRQDERVQELLKVVNALLQQYRHTRSLVDRYRITTYSVTPLAPTVGMCRWIEATHTMAQIIKDQRASKRVNVDIEFTALMKAAGVENLQQLYTLTRIQRAEAFDVALETTADQAKDLYDYFWQRALTSEMWLDRRNTFTKSNATMSMVGHVLGLGDRHPNNLLLHKSSGRTIHIDFGDCFEVAMQRKRFPESVPFRLTRMMTTAMGVGGIEGMFPGACEYVLEMLWDNREIVSVMLDAFIHDPLVNWNADAETALRTVREKLEPPALRGGNDKEAAESAVKNLIYQATCSDNLSTCYLGWSPYW
eukprot:PhM_4_TR18722/c0_g1_i1/m.11763/K07203/MTOR, FRAP, TOR; serine/threonine-protein kinase mTOR